jgi:Ni,Fe-hydrogenase I large subunit
MEVGPLARMLVAYASGHPRVKELVGAVLAKLQVGPEVLFSTLGRVAARGIETQVLAEKMGDWVDALAANMGSGELRIHDNSKWEPDTWPADATGSGLHEAPRSPVVSRFARRSPTTSRGAGTWNAGPVMRKGRRNEEALIGTPVADPQNMSCAPCSFDPAWRAVSRRRRGA